MEVDRIQEDEEEFESIDKLISQGIEAGDVKKLKDAGIYTFSELMKHDKYSLQTRTRKVLSEEKLEKLFEATKIILKRDRIKKEQKESACRREYVDYNYISLFPGISAEDVEKLEDAGIYTYKDLMKHYMKSSTGIKGLSEANIEDICETAKKLLVQGFLIESDLIKDSFVQIPSDSQGEADFVTDTYKKAMPLTGAVAASPTGVSHSWGLLHRVVLFIDLEAVDLDLSKPSPIPLGAPFGISREPLIDMSFLPSGVCQERIPQVSIISINRSLLPISVQTITGVVKCTDAHSNILIEVIQGQGIELLVCRPGNGTVLCLPPVPVSLGVKVSTGCTGIVSDSNGHFVVVQLHSSSSSSSSHSQQVVKALHFSSKENIWRVKEFRVEHRFTADTVTSHSGSLVFSDMDYGILIFNPCEHDSVRTIPFSGTAEDEEQTGIILRRCVTSSEGRLLCICIHGMPYDHKITVSYLGEEDQWKSDLCIYMDEIWCCSGYQASGLPVGEVIKLSFVHPLNWKILYFSVADSLFSIEVLPSEVCWNKLQCDVFNKCPSPENLHPWISPDQDMCSGSVSWEHVLKVAKIGKGLADHAWRKLKKNKKILDKAPMMIELIGWLADKTLPYPINPTLQAGAEVVRKIGQAIEFEENFSSLIGKSSSKLKYEVVGTEGEAIDAISRWNSLCRPKNMVVDLDYFLSKEQESVILNLFNKSGSEDLLFAHGWTIL